MHFLAYVILRDSELEQGIEAAVAARLVPHMNAPTEPRQITCTCVARRARDTAETEAELRFRHLEFVPPIARPFAECSDDECNVIAAAWLAHHAERTRWVETRAAGMAPDPDPECYGCSGSGTQTTTANPNRRCDGYEIGGRWLGLFQEFDPADAELVTCERCQGTGHVAEYEFCGRCAGGEVPRNPAALVRASIATRARALETLAEVLPDLVIGTDAGAHARDSNFLNIDGQYLQHGETEVA